MIYNSISLLPFVGGCPFIISQWVPMSDELLWFLWIEFKVMCQLISLGSVGVTTHKILVIKFQFFSCMNLNMTKL